jgi:hypothetical protein
VTDHIDPIVDDVRRAERRYATHTEKAAEAKSQLDELRKKRDARIRDDTDGSATTVGRRYGVTAAWVWKVRKDAAKSSEGVPE